MGHLTKALKPLKVRFFGEKEKNENCSGKKVGAREEMSMQYNPDIQTLKIKMFKC